MENVFTFPLRLFSFILSSSLMSVILIFLILIAKYVFKHKQGAKWHYYIWFVLIFRMVLPWSPESSFSVFNLFSYEKQASVIRTSEFKNNNVQVESVKPAAVKTASDEASLAVDIEKENTDSNTAFQEYLRKFNIDFRLLFWIWLYTALGIGLFIILNCIIFEIKLRKHKANVSSEIFYIFWNCKCKLGIRSNIPLIGTPYVKTPTLVGYINPRILLPINVMETINIEQLNYVFIHELVHYRRGDIGINLLTSIILVFHWFNPLLWYAFYNMKEDQEISCDALALSYIKQNEVREYALTLIKLLESFKKFKRLPGTAGIGGNKLQISKRIKMIKAHKKGSIKGSIIGIAFIVMLSVTSLTNPRAGILNTNALAREIKSSTPVHEAMKLALKDYSFNSEDPDERAIAYIIANYMNAVGNMDYRTITGLEGFEYLVPAAQTQADMWIEDSLFRFKKNKLVYGVNDIGIDFIFLGHDAATACLTGKISRISSSEELPNIYENSFKALFTLKKYSGQWYIVTAPSNDSLAQMLLLSTDEEDKIKGVINAYVKNNFTYVESITTYISPLTASPKKVSVKCILRTTKALEVNWYEKEFKLEKIDNSWAIVK